MAQDTRKITIEILSTGKTIGTDSGGVKTPKKEEDEFSLNKLLHPMNNLAKKADKSLFGKTYFFTHTYNTIKSLSKSATDLSIQRYFNLSENYLAENTYNNIKNNIQKAGGLASSVISGGMLGGVAGAAVGAVAWGANELISYNNTLSSYHSAINTSVMGTQFSNIRASLYNNGRGTEN